MNSVKHDAFDAYHFEEHWTYDKPRIAKAHEYEEATQDIFSALFRRKWNYTENPDSVMRDFLETFKATEEYKHLRASTCGKVGAAYEAARNLAPIFAGKKDDAERNRPEPSDAEKRGAARKMLRDAQKKADDYEEIEQLLGFGSGPGDEGAEFDNAAKIDLIKQFRDNPRLMRLVRIAGRMINLAENTIHNETTRGVDKLVGVELSDNINRVVPSELWMAEIPDLFLYRVINKEVMCLKYEGDSTKGFGPIVLLVDRSSSMNEFGGEEKWDYARALMFSIAHLAFAQKREIQIVMFNDSVEAPYSPKTPADVAKWMLTWRAGGGTNFDRVFHLAAALVNQKPAADIVMLTDGEGTVSNSVKEALKADKEKLGLKIFSIVCGTKIPTDLADISNEAHTVARLLAGDELNDATGQVTKQIMQGVIR